MMIGKQLPFLDGKFSGAMLNFQGVTDTWNQPSQTIQTKEQNWTKTKTIKCIAFKVQTKQKSKKGTCMDIIGIQSSCQSMIQVSNHS